MIVTKVRVERDPSTFVPIVKFEGQFKMEPDIEYPYGRSDDAAAMMGITILEQIVAALKVQAQKDKRNAY